MDLLGSFQGLVALLLGVGALGFTGFAFVDAARRPAEAYTYAGKRTKQFWLIILGVAFALTFVLFSSLSSLFFLALAVAAAAIYTVDVKPAVSQYRGGSGSNRGPYGGW